MRHWYIYIILYAVVGVFGLSPFCGNDIATLSPVEAVWLEEQQGSVYIETDGGDFGIGASVAAALENMKCSASSTVFLDTADFVIVKQGSEALLSELRDILRPSCGICVADAMPDLVQAAGFLGVHEPSVKMKNIERDAGKLPILQQEKGRLMLIEQDNIDSTADCMADRCSQCTDSELRE